MSVAITCAALACSCAQVLGIKDPPPADAGASGTAPGDAAAPLEAGDPNTSDALATFSLLVDGNEAPTSSCTDLPFDYKVPTSYKSVALQNTGTSPVAYVIRPFWSLGVHYMPGVGSSPQQASGVLLPGQTIDFTRIWGTFANGGIVAIVGSASRFAIGGTGAKADVGVIPWPDGVDGSGGATEMHVAEITVNYGCGRTPPTFW